MKHGKKYVDSFKAIDKAKQYDAPEALELAAKGAKAKFDETIELHIRLGVDSRHANSYSLTSSVWKYNSTSYLLISVS